MQPLQSRADTAKCARLDNKNQLRNVCKKNTGGRCERETNTATANNGKR